MTLRFDQSDAAVARLNAHINAVQDRNPAHNDPNNVRNDIALSRPILDDVGPAIQTSQKRLDGRLVEVQDAIMENIEQTVRNSQQRLDGRLVEVQDAIMENIEQTVRNSQQSLNNQIDQVQTAISQNIKQTVRNSQQSLNNQIDQVQNAISQNIKQVISDSQHHVDDKLGEVQNAIVANIRGTKTEIRAGQAQNYSASFARLTLFRHFNGAARLVNRFASCCNDSISNFRSIDNQRIPNFPATYAEFHMLQGETHHFVSRLRP